MLSLDGGRASALEAVDLRLADVNVRIAAPHPLARQIDLVLAGVPRFDEGRTPELTIVAAMRDDAWEITGDDGSRKVLAATSAVPHVIGAAIASAVHGVAAARGLVPMRATVIARDGRALAMIGDDWESAIGLATHLHGRGWAYVGADHALFDPQTHTAYGVGKSLYVNASSISEMPLRYRRAVEASPWYVTPQGIAFYAVDPRAAGMAQTWLASAPLRGVVVVDGAMDDTPSLEAVDAKRRADERLARFDLDWSQVALADVRIGGFVETCDVLEHWFETTARSC